MASSHFHRGDTEDLIILRATIFALATGALPTAIAIVRISGPMAFPTLLAITSRPLPPWRRMSRRSVHDETGAVIDHALVVAFAGPASVTGDDLVELHLHGGVAVVSAVLALLDRRMLTAATAGAFTRRAFDNGKLDLGQVEALGDLVGAETDEQRRTALARSGTELAAQVDRWRSTLLDIRAHVEAALDFADEDHVVATVNAQGRSQLAALCHEIAVVRDNGVRAKRLHSGVTIAIVGPTNSGKSTLLNALARRDVAIVSPIPGSTRDAIEVRVAFGGVPTTLIDTAGERVTTEELEVEAIRRGHARSKAADIVLNLGESKAKNAIRIVTKSDLREEVRAGWHGDVLYLSALTGAGVDLLELHLTERVGALTRTEGDPLIAHRWQVMALSAAEQAILAALDSSDTVIVAEELRRAAAAIEQLIGRVTTEELLDSIFARFCIGK